MALRSIPIHKVGNRDNLFFGCDREAIMFLGLCCFALVFSALALKATVVGIILWITGLYLLRLAAKSDAKLRFVYLRNFKYRTYYPARSTPFRDNSPDQLNQYNK
jgi:type IV secretion system protein TrbD